MSQSKNSPLKRPQKRPQHRPQQRRPPPKKQKQRHQQKKPQKQHKRATSSMHKTELKNPFEAHDDDLMKTMKMYLHAAGLKRVNVAKLCTGRFQ